MGQKNDLKILCVGIGNGGGNAINYMIAQGVEGVEFIVVNTDAQDLERSFAPTKFQIGNDLTKGLGTDEIPNTGRKAAMEDKEHLVELVQDYDMVFVVAGMGGGTGTGAAPVVAQIAKKCGALTVAIVTRPFLFEGKKRRQCAEKGLEELINYVDTLITISSQRLISIADKGTTMVDAFKFADQVLHQAVKGLSDLMNLPSGIGVDFTDICTIMKDKGQGLMGIGQAAGEGRVMQAAYAAINSPLLDEVSLAGAKSVLVNITSSSNLGIIEVSEATQMIQEEVHEDVNLIFGWIVDDDMRGDVRITVVATEFDEICPDNDWYHSSSRAFRKTQEIPTIIGGSKIIGGRSERENRSIGRQSKSSWPSDKGRLQELEEMKKKYGESVCNKFEHIWLKLYDLYILALNIQVEKEDVLNLKIISKMFHEIIQDLRGAYEQLPRRVDSIEETEQFFSILNYRINKEDFFDEETNTTNIRLIEATHIFHGEIIHLWFELISKEEVPMANSLLKPPLKTKATFNQSITKKIF